MTLAPGVRFFAVLVAGLLVLGGQGAAQGSAAAASYERGTLDVGGVSRSYGLYLPPRLADEPALVVMLHGRGGSGERAAALAGFDELAAEYGSMVAYPDGLNGEWNYLAGVGSNSGPDDVEFLHRLVDELVGTYRVDPRRVFVVGYSNGGFMAQRLACEAGSPFSAYATVAAAGFGGMPQVCREPRPLSIMLVHGTADDVVPWSGHSTVIAGRELLLSASVPQTLGFWAAHGGCGGASERSSIPLPGPLQRSVEVLRVTDCPAGEQVVLYAVVGGGHEWPRGDGTAELEQSSFFDAGEVVWEFFERAGPD